RPDGRSDERACRTTGKPRQAHPGRARAVESRGGSREDARMRLRVRCVASLVTVIVVAGAARAQSDPPADPPAGSSAPWDPMRFKLSVALGYPLEGDLALGRFALLIGRQYGRSSHGSGAVV